MTTELMVEIRCRVCRKMLAQVSHTEEIKGIEIRIKCGRCGVVCIGSLNASV